MFRRHTCAISFRCARCEEWIAMGDPYWALSFCEYTICQSCYDQEPHYGVDVDKAGIAERGQKHRVIHKSEPMAG